jgi:imidazolonepropionase-like amidohydrolase
MLRPGAVGDLVVLDALSPGHIAYRPATNLAWATVRHGAISHRV